MTQDLIAQLIDLCNGGRFREAYSLYIENRVDDINIRSGIESALKTVPNKLTTVPPDYCTAAEIVCKTGMHGGDYMNLIESLTDLTFVLLLNDDTGRPVASVIGVKQPLYKRVHIRYVAVDPDCQGHGYGTQIMKQLMETYRDHYITLEPGGSQIAQLRKWYTTFGFVSHGLTMAYNEYYTM